MGSLPEGTSLCSIAPVGSPAAFDVGHHGAVEPSRLRFNAVAASSFARLRVECLRKHAAATWSLLRRA